jgi:hypothetical protein
VFSSGFFHTPPELVRAVAQLPQDRPALTGAAASADAVPFRSHTWAGLPRGDQATLTSASVSAPMAPSFFPRRLCRPTCCAHGARGGWNHSRRCPRDIRPPEPLHCPVDTCPVDIFAQRQHVWIARPTLKAIDQEQSLAAVHHCSLSGSYLRVCPPLRPYFPLSWHDV